jgi:RNA polymerase sigma-70 factor (ECF subfamily)
LADEQELLRQARSLDESALETIFDTYYQPLYRYIYYHVRHVGTAEDLAADVFSRMLDQIAKGRGPKRHLSGWLYRVAHNLVVDDSRRRVHRDHESLDERVLSSEPDVETQVQLSVLRQQAWAALGKLTIKQRDVIVLRFLEGQENDEIAQVLRMSVGAVKALQHRGLASMRRHLNRMSGRKEESR